MPWYRFHGGLQKHRSYSLALFLLLCEPNLFAIRSEAIQFDAKDWRCIPLIFILLLSRSGFHFMELLEWEKQEK